MAPVPWSAEEKRAFLLQQFDAQTSHYRAQYAEASFAVVLRDGELIGRLSVARWPGEVRIVDIALLPECRGRGIGSRLLEAVIEDADAAGKAVTIHVDVRSPARRLYERLGFRQTSASPTYLLMEHPAGTRRPRSLSMIGIP